MREVGQGGSIINISSVARLIVMQGCAAYAAAKGGVRSFSKAVALECARDRIRVNSVHPGMIMTNIQKDAMDDNVEILEQISASIRLGYFGEPIDVSNINLFRASDESWICTGPPFFFN